MYHCTFCTSVLSHAVSAALMPRKRRGCLLSAANVQLRETPAAIQAIDFPLLGGKASANLLTFALAHLEILLKPSFFFSLLLL